MAKENRTRYAVLGMLHYGDFTGYEIRKRLAEMIGSFWQEPSASVYPALKALEAEGSVIASRELPESGPARIRYSVTPPGRAAFAAWLAQDPQPTAMRNEFALKLMFGNLAEPATMLRFVAGELAIARGVCAGIDDSLARLPEDDQALMWRLVADYGRSMAQATIEWCDRAERAIREAGMHQAAD
jgi:DNA-binding PadR family transcriptional regulator